MSKIEFEQISENEIEVVIPPETPMEMVQQLTKSFNAKGLVEDLRKSTLSVRYFYRPEDKTNQLADKLIKSLQGLAKEDELPYWHPKSQFANQKRVREMDIAERRAKNGVAPTQNVTTAPQPNIAIPKPTTPTTSGPKMYDSDPKNQMTAGGSGKRYVFINDPIKKEEHEEDCECEKCDLEKSGYKGYDPADNARRKMKNIGDQTGFGTNVNTKQYTSAKYSGMTPQTDPKLKRPQPVKVISGKDLAPNVTADILARASKKVKKSWGEHLPFPNAEEEMVGLAKAHKAQQGEDIMANQLANLMAGKSMLGPDANHVVKAMMASPPPQPTDEQMFSHLVVSEDIAKAAEQNWNGTLNSFYTEATKPLSSRFSSEEEELTYWNNIKVNDRDDGSSGY